MRKRFFPLLLALILLLAGCGKRSRDNIHLLTRFSPDFTPYVGFLDTDYLLDESWYWVECETPATGVITRINLSDVKFSVEQTDAAGNHQERDLSNSHTIISGATGSSHAFSTRYSDESITSEPLAKADYVFEENGAIRQIAYSKVVNQGTPQSTTIYAYLFFTYDEQGRLIKQIYTPFEKGSIFTRAYLYDAEGKLSRWEETDMEGTLLAYADYCYAGTQRDCELYSADGTLTESSFAVFDAEGRLLESSHFDPNGKLLQRVSYSYDLPESQFSPLHFLMLTLLVLAAGFYLSWQVIQMLRNRRYNRAPVIEIRARLVEKTEGEGSALADSVYHGFFETGDGHRFRLAMEKDHYLLMPENSWGKLRYKAGWMVSFYEEAPEKE